MTSFILGRLWQGLIVIFCVVVFVFVLTRMIGDPVQVMLPLEATPEIRAEFERQLGLDRPILEQFFVFLRDVALFDFGESLWQRRPAIDIIQEKIGSTLMLSFAAIGLAIVIAIPLGVIAALKPEGLVDRIIVVLSLAGLSVPQFWLGLLFIVFFSLQLGWLPTSGAGGFKHLILPALTLAVPAMTRIVMITRSTMIDQLNTQYIRTCRAKGIAPWRIVWVHALRNSMVAVFTLSGWELIRALSGYTLVVESIFAWPGLGLTSIQAIVHQDLILVQAVVFLFALIVVGLNLIFDLCYKVIDPRIDLG